MNGEENLLNSEVWKGLRTQHNHSCQMCCTEGWKKLQMCLPAQMILKVDWVVGKKEEIFSEKKQTKMPIYYWAISFINWVLRCGSLQSWPWLNTKRRHTNAYWNSGFSHLILMCIDWHCSIILLWLYVEVVGTLALIWKYPTSYSEFLYKGF